MKLNDKTIKAIEPPAKGQAYAWDDEVAGFGLRITAAGARSFILNYRVDGRERRTTIGKYPAWTATAAREKAKELRREVDGGADPLEAKEAKRAAPTFGDLASDYWRIEGSKQRGVAGYKAMLERDVLPHWRHLKVEDIKRRDVIRLVEDKAQTAPVAANRVFSLVRRIFNFAIRRDIIEANPCAQVRKPSPERAKDRVLSRDELRVLWAALEAGEHFTTQTAAALKLVLLTAQRPGEVCGLLWADLDLSQRWWSLPAERSKNGLAHRIPLSDGALEVLKALPRDAAEVFPKANGGGPTSHNTVAQALRKALAKPDPEKAAKLRRPKDREPLPLQTFTPHDLRRSAASFMASAGVARFVVGRVLNHQESGVTRVYDRHSYDAEKREALATWDRLLRAIVAGETGSKVVAIA